MGRYLLQRVLVGMFVLVGVSIIVFAMVRLFPGDVVTAIMGEAGTSDPALEAELRDELGLDEPALTQYWTWVSGLVQGDLGNSLWSGQSVAGALADRVPVTVELAVLALAFGVSIGIPIGVISAVRQDRPVDYVARVVGILGVSIPDFLLASIVLAWLVSEFAWAPSIVYVSPLDDPIGNIAQFGLAAAILGYRLSATTMRMTRSTMLEILREDYVRTAWSKGLRERTIIVRHAARNALVPVLTIIGMQMGYLLAGSVVVETVFNLPGMGRLLVQSISVRDYPQIQAIVLVIAVVMILANLLVDLSYSIIDPRVRQK